MRIKKFKKGFGKQITILSGYVLSLGQFVLLYMVFLHAYFKPDKAIVVTVNTIGEADVEFVLIPVVLGFCVLGLVFFILGFRRKFFEKDI